LTPWQVDVEGSEGTDASVLDVEDVVGTLDRIWLSVEVEGEVGQAGNLVARDGVLAVPGLGGADAASNISEKHIDGKGVLTQS
jgi:hypothetical protein